MTYTQIVPTPSHDYRHSYVTLLSFSHRNSSFCRYFPEFAQSRSFANSRSKLGIGRTSLRRGNSQCRYTPHMRPSTRQTIVRAGRLAGSRANPIVRFFPSPRHLAPNRTLRQKCPNRKTSASCHMNGDLPNITRRCNGIPDLQTSAPQYYLLPRGASSPAVARGQSTRNVRERRRQFAYVALELLALPLRQTLC